MATGPATTSTSLRAAIRDHYRRDETQLLEELVERARFSHDERARIAERARPLVQAVRERRSESGGIDAFLSTYDLSSREGIVLMCLAEALLRIPDAHTADLLIKDKIGSAAWDQRLGSSHSLFVNASTWALMLTGRLVNLDNADRDLAGTFKRLLARTGEPVIRQAMLAAMRILGQQFVMGRSMTEALQRARGAESRGYRHTYDMLGESARTMHDARRYFESYAAAITAIGNEAGRPEHADRPALAAPSISVKLSALHPRYEVAQRARVMRELLPVVKTLALQAKAAEIGFTIDAEEADRLELSLDIIEALALDPELAGWNGLGLAVQAYQKRALPTLDWLAELARRAPDKPRRLMVRLVKGAYWDAEVKLAQERGLSTYPVFTRKLATDVSYLACARRLFADPAVFYPAFATHNAHTLAAIAEIASAAGSNEDWEYQRLHGMGEELYDEVVGPNKWNRPCRVYAPVGSHEDLLAYLVRRLLENGANTSFVNRIADAALPLDSLLADPAESAAALRAKPHPRIPLPRELYRAAGEQRLNSKGLDLSDQATLDLLAAAIEASRRVTYRATPLIDGRELSGPAQTLCSPANRRDVTGSVVTASAANAAAAMAAAHAAWRGWDATPADHRAALLDGSADLMQQRLMEFVALIVREGGRTQADAVAEVREAIDFCRYYAAQARAGFAAPQVLPGPTGERNELHLGGRGVFVCISPWNFPLAIFTGQIAAALAAGNSVVAKPAEQTPLTAMLAIRVLHEAGIPGEVLHFLPGDGRIGAALVADPHCAGVAFTGSTEVAKSIARTLAEKDGAIIPLIAETGGQNALIADSSALPEQLVRDVIASAFNSAGLRCSALRVLFVQADIADKVIAMLKGAMAELHIGDPGDIRSDVGPVIDENARALLEAHIEKLAALGKESTKSSTLLHTCAIAADTLAQGIYFAPRAVEIDSLSRLEREVFGPILHVIRWQSGQLDAVCEQIAATGYGLTLGIHSRIDETVARIVARLQVGNIYVNRNIIGAVVGVQPFGGAGLSGTGPKSGGPHYLLRFASERTLTVDTTAAGGNASLMSMEAD
ncbi:MAG: bifunctional proline dehydrogenase/L-glutamate gamma-semialdehyde dehydrogenase PutA [Betaproteobacteria bacterium]|nr:bifunctional proline dehydrogenase/L-glutamate gamma-semialdehyde dehydrogenase PutA [Betaproteobacteria bacterium]